MIGFIGSLFVGIFGILGKLLPGKKKDYFLEFDEAQGKGQAKTEAAPAPQKTTTPKPAKPEAKAAPAKKPTAKSENKTKAPAAKTQAPKPAAPAPAANGKVAPKTAEKVELFAPNYLLPKPTARRRSPGANMAAFVQMSREMNIRR